MLNKSKTIDDYIEDAELPDLEEVSKYEEVKKEINDFYIKYLSQNILVIFFEIYGLGTFVMHCGVILFYVSFMFFVSSTFDLSYLSTLILVGIVVSLGCFSILKEYHAKLSNYFEDKFAFSLRMISRNLISGRTIAASIESASRHTMGKIRIEFERIIKQINAGNTLEEALTTGENIYPYKGYTVFSANVKMSLKRGGSIKDSLDELAQDLVASQVIRKKTLSLTSESRGAAKILAVLPFIMLLVLKSFAVENFEYLFGEQYGKYIIIYVVTSVSIGFVLIKRMIDSVAL
ncbi:type II secretion system F family protein [Vibrio sp. AND4]|uniref:type II secretion system F family protein n=1 Tax=Vibrio sp. AND4 TaxID=314289 RepID=UPI00015F34C9|nr:type II secretion system F family protein [Vibrio sp. AND4]EDP59612.1 Flp pilus assembly protein TadB [Vibrio sp. AND4]